MEEGKVYRLFSEFNTKYFDGMLGSVQVTWSPRMTLCAGKTVMKKRGAQLRCSIRLSRPLLSQRPPHDTVNTLLHEMIHAYLYIINGHSKREGHGPLFKQHMNRINKLQGSRITVYHNFRKEVDKFRVHVYRCDGPCVSRRPFFGLLRRAIPRPPGPMDPWWGRHQQECGGTFHKIKGPDTPSDPHITDSASTYQRYTKLSSHQQAENNSQQYNTDSRRNVPLEHRKNSSKNMPLQPQLQGSRASSMPRKGRYEEDEVVQRIKDKYGNKKRSIMISREEATGIRDMRETQEGQRKGVPLPVATRAHGRIKTTYTPKCHLKLNVQKYLDNYHREQRHSSVSRSRVLEGQSNRHSHTDPGGSYQRADRENLPNAASGKVGGSRRNAFIAQEVDKYMKRLHDYRRGVDSTCKANKGLIANENGGQKKVDVDGGNRNNVMASSSAVPVTRTLPNNSGTNKNFKEQQCPICSVTVAASEYDLHLQSCFGDDLDFDDLPEEPVTPVKSQTIVPSDPLLSDPDFFDDSPEDCVVDVKTKRDKSDSFGKSVDNSKNSMRKLPTGAEDEWSSFWCEGEGVGQGEQLPCAPCPNCGCSVLEEEMPVHIKYCVCSDEDDDDGDDDDDDDMFA